MREKVVNEVAEVSGAQSTEDLCSQEKTSGSCSKHRGKPLEGFEQESFMI